jgi:hypothetical protein
VVFLFVFKYISARSLHMFTNELLNFSLGLGDNLPGN